LGSCEAVSKALVEGPAARSVDGVALRVVGAREPVGRSQRSQDVTLEGSGDEQGFPVCEDDVAWKIFRRRLARGGLQVMSGGLRGQ